MTVLATVVFQIDEVAPIDSYFTTNAPEAGPTSQASIVINKLPHDGVAEEEIPGCDGKVGKR